ncbi:tyrosine-type recombinase/integrase [Patescibacteria group bacterium]|nr:tyrosine-type recombinase/integrase [Patescibacteria group bacterium]MBU4367848.1 tyrosine-type recombinase/integrase [Patescibacteria group bacterium]MBU4461697.1 tyrosine-type recombinase/integrase [Patescibacteria group bacterium]MCG2700318.1 tyrosine-type recombinase/integrase [Candidatus Parcubacteria bacterium]
MEKSNKPIIKHIPDFLDYCEVEKGLANNTQENYLHYLNKFSGWLKKKGLTSLLPHQLTPEQIWDYRLYLSRTPSPATGKLLSKGTQNYYLIALRAFLGYFVAKDILSIPPDKIVLPKADKGTKTVKFLTLEQIGKLLASVEPKGDISTRDRAILETFFSTGLRIAELVALNLEQFSSLKDKKDMELGIIGKGNKPRVVYFSERALNYIKNYLKIRNNIKNANTKALFINFRDKNEDADARLTPRSIERMVKKYALLSGVPVFTTPHTLRHSYATDLLNQGVDLRSIQEFLGHSNIATTQIYTHVTNKRLRDLHRQFHGDPDKKN